MAGSRNSFVAIVNASESKKANSNDTIITWSARTRAETWSWKEAAIAQINRQVAPTAFK